MQPSKFSKKLFSLQNSNIDLYVILYIYIFFFYCGDATICYIFILYVRVVAFILEAGDCFYFVRLTVVFNFLLLT